MISLKKILGIKPKEQTRDFTDEESGKLIKEGLYEQIYRPNVTENYIADALKLAQSMETIMDGVSTGHMDSKSSQNETRRLINNFKDKYPGYFLIR